MTSINKIRFVELTTEEYSEISGGISIWRYVGFYLGCIQNGMDSTTALIAAGRPAYTEN